jgi:hypothetical protein
MLMINKEGKVVSQITLYFLYTLVQYFGVKPYGPWSKVVHYKRNRMPFGDSHKDHRIAAEMSNETKQVPQRR